MIKIEDMDMKTGADITDGRGKKASDDIIGGLLDLMAEMAQDDNLLSAIRLTKAATGVNNKLCVIMDAYLSPDADPDQITHAAERVECACRLLDDLINEKNENENENEKEGR